MTKPFRGEIHNWWKSPCSELSLKYYKDQRIKNLGYVICGDIEGHPWFKNSNGRGNFQTSLVVFRAGDLLETLNSIYTLKEPKAKESLTP